MVLDLWLKEVPEGTAGFLILLLAVLIVQQMGSPLIAAVSATGNIKKYQIISGGLMITVVPAAYIVLKMGGAPWMVFAVYLVISILAYIATIRIVLPQIQMDLKDYSFHVLRPCAFVLFLSLITPVIMKQLTGSGILFSLLNIAITVVITGVLCFTLGIDKEMRKLIISKARKITGGKSS